MKKFTLFFIIIFTLIFNSASSFAIIKNLSFFGGYTTFTENFKPDAEYGGALDLITADGIGFHVSASYIKTKSKSDKYYDLKMVPIMAGLTYYFFPYRQISPYLSALVSMNLTSQYMENPLSGYAICSGFFFRMDKFSGVFVEAKKSFTRDSETGITLDPFSINAGVTLTLWGLDAEDDTKYEDYQKEVQSRRGMREKRKKRLIQEELDLR